MKNQFGFDESYVQEIINAATRDAGPFMTERAFAHFTVLDVQAGYGNEVREAWRRYRETALDAIK